ncbi:MAG: GNAT family N-acetyltransferase [Gemmatimonadetes bacterium]|nr:GNAT family N-acetyltransferase [Gemmatimonadota bacterium]
MRSIRSAVEADWSSVWSIISQVAATGHSCFLETDISEAAAKEYWMGPRLSAYVAEDAGEIVGTYTLKANHRGLGSHVANAGYMVRPGLDGRGIGFQLAEHSLAEARAAGFQAMQFNAVVSTNYRAIALWQRLGFSVVGTVPKAFRHLEHGLVDLHIMHRFL